MKALGPDADRLNVAFVTIDPERDTPVQLAHYLSSFDPRIHGLTGTPANIATIACLRRIEMSRWAPVRNVAHRRLGSGGGYTMDHSSAIYLMDAHGGVSGVIGYQEASPRAIGKLRALVRP